MVQERQSNDPVTTLLACLADGECHSGAELGRLLGVSRTAVWKHLQKLDELGLPLTPVRGRGYRLDGGLELLRHEAIEAGLTDEARAYLQSLELFSVTDSTNARALEKAAQSHTGYVCLAEHQLAGRGRRGRHWVSPFGSNLYLSASWGFDGGAAQLEGLSLAVGVALCQVLEQQGLQEVSLKWPNDLLWRGRKLAGVLLEMAGDPAGQCHVVVGIGLNLAMPGTSADAIGQPWVDVRGACAGEGVAEPSRNQLAAALINALLPLLAGYHQTGFAAYLPAWQQRDAYAGQPVVMKSARREQRGIARGVDVTGALRLEVDGAIELCHGGELSMRAVS